MASGRNGNGGKNKNPSRSFHNLTSNKKNAKSAASAMRKSLMRCSSGFHEDIVGNTATNANNVHVENEWIHTNWFVINFSAVQFLPEQVRRMTGVLVAVVSGMENMNYIDRVFGEGVSVKTPICPAGATWLDRIVCQKEAEIIQEIMLNGQNIDISQTKEVQEQNIRRSIVFSNIVKLQYNEMMEKMKQQQQLSSDQHL